MRYLAMTNASNTPIIIFLHLGGFCVLVLSCKFCLNCSGDWYSTSESSRWIILSITPHHPLFVALFICFVLRIKTKNHLMFTVCLLGASTHTMWKHVLPNPHDHFRKFLRSWIEFLPVSDSLPHGVYTGVECTHQLEFSGLWQPRHQRLEFTTCFEI